MKKLVFILFVNLGLLAWGQREVETVNNVSVDVLRSRINTYVKKYDIPALSVAFIEDGNVTFIHSGHTKRDQGLPVSEGSVFQIASLSKTFTAIIAKKMLAEGKLDLTTSISGYLPEQVTEKTKSKVAHITIADLLQHRSGFPHDGPSLPPTPNGAPQKELYTKSMLLKDLTRIELNAEAKKRFMYSNYGYALLGCIMEEVSAKKYTDLLQKYVLGPYELKHTVTSKSVVPRESLVMPYAPHKRNLELQPWVTGTTVASGGVFSSIQDLSDLMLLQLEAYAAYDKDEIFSALVLTDEKKVVSGRLEYGFGMFESIKGRGERPIRVLGHGGDLDGYGSHYDFYPELKLGLIMLTSSGGKNFIAFHSELERFLLGLPPLKEITLSKKELKKYRGTYEFDTGQRIHLKQKGTALLSSGKGIPTLQLHPLSTSTFFLKEFDARYEFEFDASGAVAKLVYVQYGKEFELKKVQ